MQHQSPYLIRITRAGNVLLLLGLSLLLWECGRDKIPQTPNIIFILADDLGYGDVACLNPDSRIPTPNIDRLASGGILFSNAHAPAAVCTPTRYSILTGRYPWRSRLKMGVLWIWDPPLIEEEEYTLGEMLKSRGYHTACIGKWHLGWDWPTVDGRKPSREHHGENVAYAGKIENGPTTRGFDTYFGDDVPGFPPHAFIEDDRLTVMPSEWYDRQPGAPGAMAPGWRYEQLLPSITEKAGEYIRERTHQDPSRPFFLFFSLTAPHTPIAPLEKFSGKSRAGRYGDFVYQVDHSVGQIMQIVDSLDLSGSTLVIFSSDNGAVPFDGTDYKGEFGSLYAYGHDPNGGLRGVKSDAWEGGHRVPLIASWPGKIAPGRSTDELVSLTGLMATLASLTGSGPGDSVGVDSHSFLSLLLDDREKETKKTMVTQSGNGILSLHRGPWKLIMSSGSGGSWSRPRGELPSIEQGKDTVLWKNVQLYNLEEDPDESNNLAGENPGKTRELAGILSGLIRSGRSTPGPDVNEDFTPWRQVAWTGKAATTIGEPADRIRKDTFFTRLFHRTGEGFTGGDGTYSVPLPDGRTVWIFGDTFIGGVNPDGKTRYMQTPIYIRNSMVVQDGTELETLYREHNNRNTSWIIHPDAIRKDGSLAEDSIWFWPGDGYCEGGLLKVFLSEFIRTGSGMWDFQWTGTWLASFGLPDLELRELKPLRQGLDAGAHLGHALLEDGPYIHVYGSGDGKPYAARFPRGGVTGPWEFYDGVIWTGDASKAEPMEDLVVSEQFSVFKRKDLYILVTQIGIGDEIVSYTSETPYGPWGKRTLLYKTPIPDSTGNLFTYNALAHPRFTEKAMLLVSYNMNSMRLLDLYRNTGIYRPRFIRVPLEMIDPSLAGEVDDQISQR